MRLLLPTVLVSLVALLSGCSTDRGRMHPTTSPSTSATTGQTTGIIRADGQERGYVLLLHGGGWRATPQDTTSLMRPLADALSARGYTAQVVVQPGGRASLDAVTILAEEVKAQIGDRPLCIYGESSGGHLALMVAAALGDQVACVVAVATPVDLLDFPTDTAGHRAVLAAAHAAFGPDLSAVDPRSAAPRISARALLVDAVDDPLVPIGQAEAWERVRADDLVTRLPPGGTRWIHSAGVDGQALRDAGQQVLEFVDETR